MYVRNAAPAAKVEELQPAGWAARSLLSASRSRPSRRRNTVAAELRRLVEDGARTVRVLRGRVRSRCACSEAEPPSLCNVELRAVSKPQPRPNERSKGLAQTRPELEDASHERADRKRERASEHCVALARGGATSSGRSSRSSLTLQAARLLERTRWKPPYPTRKPARPRRRSLSPPEHPPLLPTTMATAPTRASSVAGPATGACPVASARRCVLALFLPALRACRGLSRPHLSADPTSCNSFVTRSSRRAARASVSC